MKKVMVSILVLGLGSSALVAYLRGPGQDIASRLFTDEEGEIDLSDRPSFTADSDRDGLSDAKEAIYGTDAKAFDTDRDGFSDGEEIRGGFDPTIPGNSRIEDNEILAGNLTIQYFLWAQDVGDIDDPQLSDDAVQQFLNANNLTDGPMPSVPDQDVLIGDDDSDEAILSYVDALAEIELPSATASFLDLADEVVRTQQSEILDEVITGLDTTYEEMSRITVPPRLAELHREQLASLKALRNLFLDLYSIEHDPVLLIRDINWGNALLLRSLEVEQKRLEITTPVLKAAGRLEPMPASGAREGVE